MQINIATKKELEERKNELDKKFNTVRDELSEYIKSTETEIKRMTSQMDELSKEYNEINDELDKRNGRTKQ